MFRERFCESWEEVPFPESSGDVECLRLALGGARQPILVDINTVTDGVGARFKKSVEMVGAALDLGFHSAAVAIPSEGSGTSVEGDSSCLSVLPSISVVDVSAGFVLSLPLVARSCFSRCRLGCAVMCLASRWMDCCAVGGSPVCLLDGSRRLKNGRCIFGLTC